MERGHLPSAIQFGWFEASLLQLVSWHWEIIFSVALLE